jgi:hypothetical protein
MSQKATAKDIVTGILLMIKELTDEDREVFYEVWKCPKGPQCKRLNLPPERHMFCKPNSGFVNLFKHLCHCFDNEENLQRCMRGPKRCKKKIVMKCRSHWLGLGILVPISSLPLP